MNAYSTHKKICDGELSASEFYDELQIFEISVKTSQSSAVKSANDRQKNSNGMAIGYMEEFARRGLVYVPKVEGVDVRAQMLKMAAEIVAMYEPVEVKSDDSSKWISNVGRNRVGHPETLNSDTNVEVKFRNGTTEAGNAKYWYSQWIETIEHLRNIDWDIVAYRII